MVKRDPWCGLRKALSGTDLAEVPYDFSSFLTNGAYDRGRDRLTKIWSIKASVPEEVLSARNLISSEARRLCPGFVYKSDSHALQVIAMGAILERYPECPFLPE
jgi:hypothetical protein